ncbi:MAG: alpha/beta hydrolase-fold protein [Candidatus Cybelea sp.]
MILRALGVSAVVAFCTGVASGSLDVNLRSVAASYYADAAKIEILTGRDSTMDYYQRLLDDADLAQLPAPNNYSIQTWRRLIQAEARLDLSLATQLLHDSFAPLASLHGLAEAFVRSSKDGTMQPVALYVPSTYTPEKPAPLVVFLHGRLQPESHLIAPEFIESLAESTGTIIVAPYGRGYYDYRGSESDVYDALDAATRAFKVDERKRYLVGYSMGGFSLFRIAPIHPERWSAVMCVSGSLLASRAAAVATTMRSTRFYVLTGARDDNVPTAFPTATAIFLRDAGFSVSFYSQPDGTHAMYSLRTILARAWTDMESGVVRLPIGLSGGGNLPDAVPQNGR